MDPIDLARLAAAPTLALADVHRITTAIAGRETDVFVFDHHRTAFTLWCDAARRLGRPLDLVTLDRHMDLEPHHAAPPPYTTPLADLDAFARHALAPTNDSHIRAAFDAGAIGRALVIARSHAPDDLATFDRVTTAPTLARLGPEAHAFAANDTPLALDIDLDCFTTRSDGHADEVLAWDRARIEDFLHPPGADAFWNSVLPRVRVVTIAREPYHCGGFTQAARLWIDFSAAFFEGLLGVPSP